HHRHATYGSLSSRRRHGRLETNLRGNIRAASDLPGSALSTYQGVVHDLRVPLEPGPRGLPPGYHRTQACPGGAPTDGRAAPPEPEDGVRRTAYRRRRTRLQ